jgi:hypothetical protein
MQTIFHKCAEEFSPLFTVAQHIGAEAPDTAIFNDRFSRFSKPPRDNPGVL